jgi:CO/xanthine dehydrogenase Mo-binding subunit
VVDEICEQKGWDPLQFRIDNAATEGTRRTDAVPMFSIGLEQVLNTAQKSDHWLSEKPASSGKTLRGRGIAVGFSPHMGGPSSVRISLNRDGTISLSEGSQDIGGTRVALAMIAAEALSIPVESVHPSIPSTNDIGYTYATAGSRVINATGQAVWEAAHALIEKAKSQAADVLETPKDQISFSEGLFKGTSEPTRQHPQTGLPFTFAISKSMAGQAKQKSLDTPQSKMSEPQFTPPTSKDKCKVEQRKESAGRSMKSTNSTMKERC